MKKITKLTNDQEQRLVEFREEWRQIGLCCDPADFETGDEVIRGFYRRFGKPDPIILHFSSPAMCELAVNFVFAVLKDAKPKKLRSQLRSQLWSQLGSQLESQLGSQLASQLGSQLESQLRSQLGSQLASQLGSQLRSQLWSQLESLKSYFYNNCFGAQHWCAWEAFYLFGHEIGVTYKADDIALLLEWGRLSKSVGWWAPWDGICFVSDRPRHVQFDDARRLHSETGMAVCYSDAWGTHAWHGVRVPADWIESREKLTADIALKQENAELRRAACEIVGWDNILLQLNAVVVDADADPEIGTLLRVDLPEAPQEQFLRVQCGTGRLFALPVPPECKSAIEAQAWLWGLKERDFIKPEVRT